MILPHFFSERRRLFVARVRFGFVFILALAFFYHRNKRTQADSRRAEVINLIYFERGVDPAVTLQNFLYLVGGDSVKPAPERVELYKL
jgi:hypothetical protein